MQQCSQATMRARVLAGGVLGSALYILHLRWSSARLPSHRGRGVAVRHRGTREWFAPCADPRM